MQRPGPRLRWQASSYAEGERHKKGGYQKVAAFFMPAGKAYSDSL
ncbi:hypothetical protein QF008_003088 [Pseudomonas protegens]|jgi:hypothetical protein|nr:hypothetical protein [Pseudomonas protegens]BCQ71026.1 hypothetical protein PEQA60_50160 [Pseudomonas sp. Eqa60]